MRCKTTIDLIAVWRGFGRIDVLYHPNISPHLSGVKNDLAMV
jgi:hypothetical protein